MMGATKEQIRSHFVGQSRATTAAFPSATATANRRDLLAGLGAFALSAALPRSSRAATPPNSGMTRAQIAHILQALLRTDNPAMFRFAVDVYQHCIFARVQSAEPPLKHAWLVPGGVYVGQWIWDTTFLTDLLAIVPR